MTEKKKSLGKGLAVLFGDEDGDYASLDRVRSTKNAALDAIFPNEKQPRRHFDEEALESLADSIRESGLLQPIVVRRHPSRPSDYEIVAGERRWRASQRAGLRSVPVVVRNFTDEEVLQIAIVENVQRQSLTVTEEAVSYRRLMEEFGRTQEEVSRVIGKSRSHIANMLRLLTLPARVQKSLDQGLLSMGHARVLVSLDDAEAIMDEVLGQRLSVRETEKLAKKLKKGLSNDKKAIDLESGDNLFVEKKEVVSPRREPSKSDDTLSLERDLSKMLGLEVNIEIQGKGGVISVHYNDLNQLDDFLRRLS